MKIKVIDILTLGLYKHRSGRNTRKSLWLDFKEKLGYSHKTLVVNLNRFARTALLILYSILKQNRKNARVVKHTGSTDIPVCMPKNVRGHETMKLLSAWGHSGKGLYYGLKMTMTAYLERRMLALRFTAPGRNDRDIFYEMNLDLEGIFVADAGYVSKALEKKFYQEGKGILFTKERSNIKRVIDAFQYHLHNTRVQESLQLFGRCCWE